MLCPACGVLSTGLCDRCLRSLRPASIRMVSGTPVVGAFAHRGAAVALVHRVKYRRDRRAAAVLVDAMVARIGVPPSAIVPIPRAWVRRVRYGIDPGTVLATGVARRLGVPVVEALRAPWWMPRHTAKDRAVRRRRRFDLVRRPPEGALLIDDVLTTGSTIEAALEAVGPGGFSVATATAAGTMGRGADVIPEPGGGVAHERAITALHRAGHLHSAPDRGREPVGSTALDKPRRKEHG
jgi:predicted amidophosphoribosyltransferase